MNDVASILLVSHRKRQCGIYQFGLQIAGTLSKSRNHQFSYVECADEYEYKTAVESSAASVVIHNYSPTTMPWLRRGLMRRARAVQVGVIHEVTQELADAADDRLFEFYLAADPTLELRNPIVFKTGRLVPSFENTLPMPTTPTIGSFGFGTYGKGFEDLIVRVQREFDDAVIRLHIPFADFFDPDGHEARAIAERCRGLVTKPGIRVELSHAFLTNDELLGFLASNSMNAFLYVDQPGRGISSVIDYALATKRPIAVSRSRMFRHLHAARPPVTVEDSSLRSILERGFSPLAPYADAWTPDNLVRDYERIVDAVLAARRADGSSAFLAQIGRSALRDAETIGYEARYRLGRSLRGVLSRHPRVEENVRRFRARLAR